MKLIAIASLVGAVAVAGCRDTSSPVSPDPGPEPTAATSPSGSSGIVASGRSMEVPENFPFKRILCFGDSVTLGVTQESLFGEAGTRGALTLVEGYPAKLARRLEERYGTGIQIFVEGVGGENSREALDRIDTMIRRHDPDLVLILSGIVDVNVALPLVPRFPVVRESLAEMMRIVQIRGKFPIIGTYPLVNPDGFRVGAIEHIQRLNLVIRQEANPKGVPVADHEADAKRDFRGQGSDGLHPNNLGYEQMADTWMAVIELALEMKGVT